MVYFGLGSWYQTTHHIKNTGVIKMPNKVTPIMPAKTAVPSVRRISAPAPRGNHRRQHAENEGERCEQRQGFRGQSLPRRRSLPPYARVKRSRAVECW